jgi:hypothetical protein
MDMTIQEEIEQLVLRCIAADGLKACPKDISFLEKYRLKNLYFLSVRYRMEGTDCPELDRRAEGLIRWNIYSTDFPLLRRVYAREGKEALMRCLYLEEGYFRRFLEQTGHRTDQPDVQADPKGKYRQPCGTGRQDAGE